MNTAMEKRDNKAEKPKPPSKPKAPPPDRPSVAKGDWVKK